MVSPVCGFLPRLAALDRIKNVPKPVMTTFSPLTRKSLIKLKVELTASAEALLVKFAFLATFSISSFFVTAINNLPDVFPFSKPQIMIRSLKIICYLLQNIFYGLLFPYSS